MPSACAPSSIDSSPAIDASRGVRCGIVSSPTTRSIVAEAMSPLIRARARGLSLTSTTSTWPDSCSARASSSIACALPPRGGSISTETTNSPARNFLWRSVSRSGSLAETTISRSRTTSRVRGLRSSSTAFRIAAIWVGVVPQQPPMMRAPSSRACAANSAKYSGVACGKITRSPARLARPTFGSAASGLPLSPIRSMARSAAWRPTPWFAPIAATSSARERCGRLLGGDASERLRVLVEGQERDDRQRRDGADGADRGEELVELVERLDHEEVDAAALEELRLLAEHGIAILHRAAERADRAGDEDVRAGHLARVARDLHCGLVDRRDLVLEVVLGELAPVRAERVRLDDVRAGADEAEVQREDALGRADVRLLGAAEPGDGARDERPHAAVADERRAVREAVEKSAHRRIPARSAAGSHVVRSSRARRAAHRHGDVPLHRRRGIDPPAR